MTVCQVCQHQNPSGVEYCENCGAALTAPVPAGVGTAAQSAGGTSPQASPPAAPGVNDDAATSEMAAPPDATPAADAVPAAEAAPASGNAVSTPNDGASPSADAVSPDLTTPAGPDGSPATAASAGANTRPRLMVKRNGALTGEELTLQGERLVIGRFDPETGPVDIDLSAAPEAGHVSRQHGELYRASDGHWMVRDLGSTNGVFVKGGSDPVFGPRISEPRPLTDDDEVAFGNARFIFKAA